MFLKRLSELSLPKLKRDKDGKIIEGEEGEEKKEKTLDEKRQDFIEKKAAEFKKEDEKDRRELVEYHKFPNIMGWYFDGTFTSNFTLSDEYAEYFNEIEDELEAQRDLIIEETFTERAYRNFWPPHYIGGRYFRTRGIYLDMKEVKEDPPKTPPNINYEKQRGVIGIELGDGNDNSQEVRDTLADISGYGPVGTNSSRDRWFWHEDKRDFKPKEVDGDYIWCDDERIWRESDPTFRTPYDWYFNERDGRYYIRDRSAPELYEFDQERNIYKMKYVQGPSSNGLRSNDYFFDEKEKKWIRVSTPTGNIIAYHAGNREVVVGDRGKSGLTPDDFYYDGATGKMEHKDERTLQEYYYDTSDKMFKKKEQPYGPGKANHFPSDYEFDYNLGTFYPKPAKECRHVEPYDWYFDMSTGKFYLIDGLNREKYAYDPDLNIFKLKDVTGPSANGLTPEDYFWSENERQWKLTITLKDPTVLEIHDPGSRKILKGDRGKSDKVPDDFYYDAFDGSFFRKDHRKLDNYWYDKIDGVWKKRGQPYGPGFYQLYPEHYYFDYDEGLWYPTATAKLLLAKRRRGEVKGLSDLTPYDYAFHDTDDDFYLRDKNNPRMYKYKPGTGVFHKEMLNQKNVHSKTPKDYFFDEFIACWLPLEHPKGHEAKDYKLGRRNNRTGPRGRLGRIPDDYYFVFDKGTFELKDVNEPTKYEYVPDLGVWRSSQGASPDKIPAYALTTKDYYFDKEEGKFIPKKNLEYGEIALNPNTNLWMQRWRRPQDYYWESRQNKYLRKKAAAIRSEHEKKGDESAMQAAIAMEEAAEEARRRKEEGRDYERPWLHNYIFLAADEVRFEQELVKQTKKDDKSGKKKGKKMKPGDENTEGDGAGADSGVRSSVSSMKGAENDDTASNAGSESTAKGKKKKKDVKTKRMTIASSV